MADDGQEKTEQATEKRMKEVRSKGQLSKSQDTTAWVGVGAAAVMFGMVLDRGSAAATDQMLTVTRVIADPDPQLALRALGEGLGSIASTMGPMLAAVVLAVIVTDVAQAGFHLKKFKPKFEQFNLPAGIKRTFGGQALWNGVKALLKTAVVGGVLYVVVQDFLPVLMTAGGLPVAELLSAAASGVSTLLIWAIAAGIALALADVLVVMKRNRKKTRMSKKEVKDENKQSDGDPMIKSQRRSIQMAMSRNRMISAVADADVVVVNPTHVAVALKYEPGVSAPRVVARGADHVATRIREKAAESGVPLVKDVALAWALHDTCRTLGQEIPNEHFTAVARVLAFVMMLKNRGAKTSGVLEMGTAF